MADDTILIRASKRKVLTLAFKSLVLAVCSVFVFYIANDYYEPEAAFMKIAAVIGTLFFGVALCVYTYLFFTKAPLLTIHSDGFTKFTGIGKKRFIAWDEIVHIGITKVYRQKFLAITIKNSGNASKNIFQKPFTNPHNVNISANPLDISFEELHTLLLGKWREYKLKIEKSTNEDVVDELREDGDVDGFLLTLKKGCNSELQFADVIGKKIIDVFTRSASENYGVELCDSYILLEDETIMEIPLNFYTEVSVITNEKNVDDGSNNCDEPYPDLYNENGGKTEETEYAALMHYETKCISNRLKRVKNRKIADFLFCKEQPYEKCLIELDNGFVITEISSGMQGTGQTGFWWFESVEAAEKRFNRKYIRWSQKINNDA